MEDMKIMEEFFCKVTPDGWMSFLEHCLEQC